MAAPSMELFDQYFRLADLDRDGRISGGEAVAFSQGSNLPKHVLAQIWMHADQNKTGFLGRQEFYNFLKLVTVAQSGRELTPDIVKAALFGPAAARIPAPKINAVPVPSSQMSSTATPRPQLGSTMPSSNQTGAAVLTSQNVGFRGPQVSPNMGMNQQVPSSLNNNFMRPYQPTPAAPPPMLGTTQGLTGGGIMMGPHPPPAAGVSTSIRAPGLPTSPQTPSGSATPLSPKPIDSAMFQSYSNASKALVPSGNGFSSDSAFGGNSFSATQAKSAVFTSTFSASSMPNASGTASAAAGSLNVVKPAQPDPFKNNLSLPQGGGQLQQPQSAVKQNQLNAIPRTSGSSASGIFVTAGGSADSQGQAQWPKVTQSDVKKYTKVFVEVDKDRDGKITGEEARNLFLSWRLPREVLKQVWDLSDEDNDSMLSLREFCIALYLMERYREGRPLPSELPNNLRYDETLLQVTGQPSTTYGGSSWQMSPGFSQQGIPGPRPVMPAPGVRTAAQSSVGSVSGSAVEMSQDMPKSPVFERNLQNQYEKVEQDAPDASNDDNKVEESKKILDYREKVEFYRTKMQDLVLYKSRCDNRLNEISERASADKREVESLAKKYEEKYKQVADIASKLTVEEATLRHIQERKVELQNALVKMEQGGSVDGLLQVRADRIQSDLEELAKALSERSKKHGIDVKTTASVELPFGWQPGIQEGAVDWDEEWDKFDDEGFAIAKELSVGVDNAAVSAENPPSVWSDEVFDDDVSPVESSSHIFSNAVENGSADARSEDGSTRSPRGSPGRIAFDSPAREFHSPLHDVSPHAKDSYSDHAGAESTFSGDKFADDSSVWGANFDTSDDVDSVWGFNTKDTGHSSFFDSGDFGLNPIKVDSPTSSNDFSKEKKISVFADSVPSSPLFNSSSPSRFTERPDDRSFDASSRFDSFNMHDSGFFNQRGNVARFDSMRSTADFDHSRGFSFDDGDPFGSTGPFKSSTESHSPSKGSDNWNAF